MNWRLTLRGLLRPKLARRDEYYDRRIIQQSQQEPSTCGLICFGITAVVCAARAALAPTVTELQASAHALFDRMIRVTE